MIVAICGKKQAGKNSLANFWLGLELQRLGEIQSCRLSTDGKLFIPVQKEGSEEFVDEWLNFDSREPGFLEWAHTTIWPECKNYAFADNLKDVAMNLFGLTYEQCYGTDEDKNSVVPHLDWKDFPNFKDRKGTVTARQFLQYFGTDICRRIYSPVWVNALINQIKTEQSKLALITDCRFLNEVKAVQEAGGKVIRLTRQISKDAHESETQCDDYKDFDATIDNNNMTMEESQAAFVEVMKQWDLFK